MTPEIIVGILSLIGTAVGSLAGVITANKLVIYRLEQLEKKVEKHNGLIERTYQLESDIAVIKTEIEDIKEG